MTEVGLATRDTPEAIKKALAEEARKREAADGKASAAQGAERRGGIFGWLKRG